MTKNHILLKASEPEGTRTPNLLIRSQVLYPIKLQVHVCFKALQIYYFSNRTIKQNEFF